MGIHKTRPAPDPVLLQQVLQHAASPASDSVVHYTCKLVTPMYGGGVHAGVVDAAMPIRATAIRGQLREWWRRLNGKAADGKSRDPKALFEAERAIWGGLGDADAQMASKVAVIVESAMVAPANLQPVAKYDRKSDGKLRGPDFGGLPGYALFPGQGKAERGAVTEQPKQLLEAGYPFKLTLRFRDKLGAAERQQVLDAVRWWAAFGGVGGRTRRGCGAVEVTDATRHLLTVSPDEVTAQGWKLVTRRAVPDAMQAWTDGINALKDFRQKPGVARNPGQGNRPGRSRWPEPDAIRRITSSASPDHGKPVCDVGGVFPRAAFGLPIISHFKDRDDPVDTTLKPIPNGSGEAAERMASPLIVRPYNGGNGWQPAVLCLDRDHIDRMALSLEGKARRLPYKIAAGKWQAGVHAGDIKPLDGVADAIDAFLKYFHDTASNAPAGKAPAPRPQVRPLGVVGVANVKLQIQRNGSLEAKHQKTNKSYYASGAEVAPLLQTLPDALQSQLRDGRYIWCDIEAAGKDIVAIREKA